MANGLSYLATLHLEVKMKREPMTKKVESKVKKQKGLNVLTVGFLAVVFSVFGMIIASNFDFTPETIAEVPANISQTSTSPVVLNRNGQLESPFVAVVEMYQNAVVNISARTSAPEHPWWLRRSQGSTSSGSGFFFRKEGYILTNNHVIENADSIEVRTSTGYVYGATLVGRDAETDLAVLKIELKEDIVVIPFGNSDEIKVGDWAIAIGNPFPQQGLDRTVTVGVISAKGRSNLNFGRGETPRYQSYIQTDASINPGNSGGPLLNLRGECVGVNAAISSPTGTSVGIGFAIPINLARAIVPDLIESGRARRGWLGVSLRSLSQSEAERQGLHAVKGVLIDSVFENSPALAAGIKSGDVIVKFNGKNIEGVDDLRVKVSTVRAGVEVLVEIVRNGKHKDLIVAVTDRDTYFAIQNGDVLPNNNGDDFEVANWMGMEVMPFTKEIAEAIGAEFVAGMYVRRVTPDSPGDKASITRRTIIIQINNEPVKNLEDFITTAGKIRNPKMRVPLIVQEPDGTIARKVVIGYNR